MKSLAVALDIGTTNISGALVDIDKGKILGSLDNPNEQVIYGDDVITRLKFATEKHGTNQLNKKLISSIQSLIKNLIVKARVEKKDIKTILAVGNAAMYHILFFLPVDTLARAPFSPYQKTLIRKKASDIGLKDFEKSDFIFLPAIGGFVGSDALGVILAKDIHKGKNIKLAIDLGTNGEVILGNNKKILVSSTAAGPAFEGWHISCGSRPVTGAIIDCEMSKGRIILKTIGDLPPRTIASGGLITAVATLIEKGYIDRTGRLKHEEFTIYKDKKTKIYLSQKDIRQVQLAKSAIQTAIHFLKENYSLDYKEIEEVIVTGRFGGSLNKGDLLKIGVIPPGLKQKNFSFEENLALRGAVLFLKEDRKKEIDSILTVIRHIELHKEKTFQENFARGLSFT